MCRLCNRPIFTRGLCKAHYCKARRLGAVEQVGAPSKLPRVSLDELRQMVAWKARGISNARIGVEIGRTAEVVATLVCRARKAGKV